MRGIMSDSVEGYVTVLDHSIFYRKFGKDTGEKYLLPAWRTGSPHDYTLSMADLVKSGYQVIFYDQLGVGKSYHPKNRTLFTVENYVEEFKNLENYLDWKSSTYGDRLGGFLAISYALKYQQGSGA